MGVSILTINKGREAHLINLLKGIGHNAPFLGEVIIIDMNEGPSPLAEQLALIIKNSPFPIRHIAMPSKELVLAKARNKAAELAHYPLLLFLDIDCIPAHNFIACLKTDLERYDAIISPKIIYLSQALPQDWQEKQLSQMPANYSLRDFPAAGLRQEHNAGLFWSLAFAIKKDNFRKIGGFDERYIGYGAEDTDFGFMARKANIKHLLTSSTQAYHQYHASCDPPWQHFSDIIKNAKIFYKKWQVWPMEGWLHAFVQAKLIEWQKHDIKILKHPEIAALSCEKQLKLANEK